jgi:hypothetical protein
VRIRRPERPWTSRWRADVVGATADTGTFGLTGESALTRHTAGPARFSPASLLGGHPNLAAESPAKASTAARAPTEPRLPLAMRNRKIRRRT